MREEGEKRSFFFFFEGRRKMSFFFLRGEILFGAAGIGEKFVGEKNRGNEKSNCNQGCPTLGKPSRYVFLTLLNCDLILFDMLCFFGIT